MRTKNAMQLKAIIRNKAKEAGTTPQLMMQNYLLERLLERISLSPWKNGVIIKGGMLIASFIGMDKRGTKDLDATIQGYPLTHENVANAFKTIAAIDAGDDFIFRFVRTEDIRKADEYPGIRVYILATYEKMASPITVDVTTGDVITPDVVEYSYPLMFEERAIDVMAYPITTVLAEKLETVISRDVSNTRPRDYYDLYELWHLKGKDVNPDTLNQALNATASKRGSLRLMDNYADVMNRVSTDRGMLAQWSAYARRYPYVGDLGLPDVCNLIVKIMETIGWPSA